jgi:hypothetical protein
LAPVSAAKAHFNLLVVTVSKKISLPIVWVTVSS